MDDKWLQIELIFATIEGLCNGSQALHYVLKDHLGSWTTVTDNDGQVEQTLSFDTWGNLRNPDTWSGSFSGTPKFDLATGTGDLAILVAENVLKRCCKSQKRKPSERNSAIR